jgi:hypothetical protein
MDRRYPLSEVSEAVRYYGEGHANGKVVITVEHKARVCSENIKLQVGSGPGVGNSHRFNSKITSHTLFKTSLNYRMHAQTQVIESWKM